MRELPVLTGLRGLAALAVLLGHAGWATYGWLGVDVFFWLSGTVLAWVYRDGVPHGRFFWARFARIYPCVVVATAASAAATMMHRIGRRIHRRPRNIQPKKYRRPKNAAPAP